MRNPQLTGPDDEVSEQQDVDVNGARPFRNFALAAHSQLDGLDTSEQQPGEKFGLDFHYQIQKPGLILEILRLGLVNRRPAQNVNACGFEPLQRFEQLCLTVADVGTEGKKSLFQGLLQDYFSE